MNGAEEEKVKGKRVTGKWCAKEVKEKDFGDVQGELADMRICLNLYFEVVFYVTLHPALSVHPSVRLSHFTFFGFCGLWPHYSCPNDQTTSNPALPIRTRLG